MGQKTIGLLILVVLTGMVQLSSSTCTISCLLCPCFASAQYEVSIAENHDIGSTVFTVSATDPNGDDLTYSLDATNNFTIDNSGHIIVSSDLDYETTPSYQFQVRVTDSDGFDMADITINVINEDDNAPICNESIVVYSISEGDTSINLGPLACTDADDIANTGLIYTIVSGNESGIFFIDTQGYITVSHALDYEVQTLHQLQLYVVDMLGATDYLDTTIIVILQIQPVNEYSPEFSSDTFVCPVSEAATIGSTVCLVTASDNDTGDDGFMVFSIDPANIDELDLFYIDSGIISVIHPLDFESITSYEFTIFVSDHSLEENARLTSTATVIINVIDVNDNSPMFSQDIYYVEVREDSGIGLNLIQVHCFDADPGDIGNIVYEATDGNDGGIFEIDSQSGRVRLAATVDIDGSNEIDVYLLTVQCTNTRQPHSSDTAILIIQVVSYNEFFPDPGSDYMASVIESQQLGSYIIQINGTDRDTGMAGTLTYYLDLDCPSNFYIDSVTGIIYLVHPLDYEAGITTFYCIVEVWDSELPLRPSEADVEIRLIDVNDYPPHCTPSLHFVHVSEDIIGEDILSFACTDEDTANLVFSLVDANAGVIPFHVRSVGKQAFISVTHSLDFEVQNEYTLQIEVSDGNVFSNVTVYVIVVDINEHPPIFLMPMMPCFLPENSPKGTLICRALALDSDASDDAMLCYSLLNGSSIFTVEQKTGDIFLSGHVDREMLSDYNIVVQANDFGHPTSFSSTTYVVIIIEDENDNSPMIPSLVTVAVSENTAIGTIVTAVSCTDADEINSDNSNVELNIVTISEVEPDGTERQLIANSLFAIDRFSGMLTVNGTVDYEQAQHYMIVVMCSDQGLPALSTSGTISVEITPTNEFPPVFELTSRSVNVSEITAVGTYVLHFSVTDEDHGEDGHIRYSLLDTEVPFFIDPQSGVISVSNSLDCEQSSSYHIVVQAHDGGTPTMESASEIDINIVNCSLGNLLPERSVYVTEVSENAESGTPLLTVACSSTRIYILDPPTPMYSIVSTLPDYFRVDATSGEITVGNVLPDYETQSPFTIHLECYDPNHSFIVSNFVVYISITPLNEHPPIFSNVPNPISVFENAALGSHIFTIEASDEDLGDDGKIVFSIHEANAPFIIDPHTGMLYLTRRLDYETMNSFSFTVFAQDSPQDSLMVRFSSVLVQVTVLDANDHWPECGRTVYHLVVSPFTEPGSILTTIDCTDSDEGINANLGYSFGSNEMSNLFQIRTNGELVLLETLDSVNSEILNIRIEVQDQGVPPLSTVVLVAIDLQEPFVTLSESDSEYLFLLEAEGIRNSVVMTLQDLSTELWKKGGSENFLVAVARSVTHYCALLPEACSLVSGCAEFYGTIRRAQRDTEYYSSFSDLNIAVLPNFTAEVDGSEQIINLQVQFYVILPEEANKAPFRQTNFVVPRSALSQIIDQDRTIIEAFVRDSVSPPLTVGSTDVWRNLAVILLVILGVFLSIFAAVLVAVCLHKLKKKQKNKIVPISIKTDAIQSSAKKTPPKIIMNTGQTSDCTSSNPSVSTISLIDTEEHTSMENNGRGSRSQHDILSDVDESVKSQSECEGLPAHDESAYLDNFPFTPTRTNPRKPPVPVFSTWSMSGFR